MPQQGHDNNTKKTTQKSCQCENNHFNENSYMCGGTHLIYWEKNRIKMYICDLKPKMTKKWSFLINTRGLYVRNS